MNAFLEMMAPMGYRAHKEVRFVAPWETDLGGFGCAGGLVLGCVS